MQQLVQDLQLARRQALFEPGDQLGAVVEGAAAGLLASRIMRATCMPITALSLSRNAVRSDARGLSAHQVYESVRNLWGQDDLPGGDPCRSRRDPALPSAACQPRPETAPDRRDQRVS